MRHDAPARDFILSVLAGEAGGCTRKLGPLNIRTVEQLHGAITPYLPDVPKGERSSRGLCAGYGHIREKSLDRGHRISRLGDALGLKRRSAEKLFDALEAVTYPASSHRDAGSTLSLGLRAPKAGRRSGYWASVPDDLVVPDDYVLPAYDRMGPVFDQGRRGTCVANAYAAMVDYMTDSRVSRQFLFHQCKMLDGSPDSDGTTLWSANAALGVTAEADRGVVDESRWPYDPAPGRTVHQGPPAEACFDCPRKVACGPVYIRKDTVVQDIKAVLSGAGDGRPRPVPVGLELYESFSNVNSGRTGWITMPLPGEEMVGGHAMLAVGWFEEDKLFLVRNSWGPNWAVANARGYPGHALIPYAYFRKHLLAASTLEHWESRHLVIPPGDRLAPSFGPDVPPPAGERGFWDRLKGVFS